MANTKRGAYLLPENPSAPGYRCLIVWVPDEDAYFRAVTGSLMHLEKWVAWERDEAHTALLAASRMKEANQLTLEKMQYVDCDFLQELLEDNDMSITVNNNVSCGQCGGSGCGTCQPTIAPDPTVIPPEVQTDIENLPTQEDDGVNPPTGFEDRATYLAHKCRAARELARDIVQTIGNFGSLSGVLSALGAYTIGLLITAPSSAFVASLLLPLITIGLSPVAAIAIVGSILMFLIAAGAGLMVYFNTLQASLASKLDEITCLLYTANSGAEARAALIQFINADVLELVFDDAGDKEVFSRAVDGILGAILAPNIFKVLFAAGVAVEDWLTERDDGFNCDDCTPPTLGEWVWSYSSGFGGESLVTVTANNPTTFHANGTIFRGSQFGAYEFRVDHPFAPSVTRVEFSYTKVSGDATRIRMDGVNVFSNAQTGTYLIAESNQPDEANFDFVSIRTIPESMRIDFSTVYSSASPRTFDWQIDNFLFS